MTDADRLRALLERTAPDRPELDSSARAAAVARRGRTARRRDRGLVAVAAVAVIAVAIGVPLALTDRHREATPAPPVAGDVEPCPAAPVDITTLGRPVAGLDDVVAVRSCPVQDQFGDQLPAEPLTGEHAQAFAEDVAALPAYEMPSTCLAAGVAHLPWALQLQTATGELLTVGSPTRTCSFVRVDDTDRDVDRVLAAFEGNLHRQTAFEPLDLDCPTGRRLAEGADTWNSSFDPAQATGGVLCYRTDPFGPQEYAEEDGGLDTDALAVIRDDLVGHLGAPTGEGGCVDTGPQRLLVLTDDHGDRAAWLDDDCSGELTGPGGSWQPSEAAEAAIEEALGGPAR